MSKEELVLGFSAHVLEGGTSREKVYCSAAGMDIYLKASEVSVA
jgi:hypothetical protein